MADVIVEAQVSPKPFHTYQEAALTTPSFALIVDGAKLRGEGTDPSLTTIDDVERRFMSEVRAVVAALGTDSGQKFEVEIDNISGLRSNDWSVACQCPRKLQRRGDDRPQRPPGTIAAVESDASVL